MLKGVAIMSMLMLHLFCRRSDLPYTPLLWIGDRPLIYFFGLFGDICVAVYCFVSGYAHGMTAPQAYQRRWSRLLRFMIRFWTIAAAFAIVGLIVGDPYVPGSLYEFVLNCLTIKNSYNGAWWYANTYILLIALMPVSIRFVERNPVWLTVVASFIFYTVGYGIRFWGLGRTDSPILAWIVMHFGLLGLSYFPYIIGMLFYKKRVISMLRGATENWSRALLYTGTAFAFAGMIIVHGMIPPLYVAVFTATATICLLCVCPFPQWLYNAFCYFGEHSTNIWLIHMFFYLSIFRGLVYCAKYPVLVYLMLLSLSLIASIAVNLLCKPILRLVR